MIHQSYHYWRLRQMTNSQNRETVRLAELPKAGLVQQRFGNHYQERTSDLATCQIVHLCLGHRDRFYLKDLILGSNKERHHVRCEIRPGVVSAAQLGREHAACSKRATLPAALYAAPRSTRVCDGPSQITSPFSPSAHYEGPPYRLIDSI